jgi:hypothetical protein
MSFLGRVAAQLSEIQAESTKLRFGIDLLVNEFRIRCEILHRERCRETLEPIDRRHLYGIDVHGAI